MYIYIITLYTLNLHNITCKLHLTGWGKVLAEKEETGRGTEMERNGPTQKEEG